MHKGVRKRILREAFKKEYPPAITKRYDKSAFATPLYHWMKKDVERFNEMGFNEKFELKNVRDQGLKWRLITFSIWANKFNISY